VPLTEIEKYLSSEAGTSALFLTNFHFADSRISLRFEPNVDDPQISERVVRASFTSAVIESIDEDEVERDTWPLDIIGFDCYRQGDRWKFVLNCGGVEWCWNSEWPSLVT